MAETDRPNKDLGKKGTKQEKEYLIPLYIRTE
jgi:hypothetical protein